MKIQNIFWVMFMMLMLVSCDTELETEADYLSEVEISTRTLTCIQECNNTLADCQDGNGQEGQSHADFLEYRDCRCPDGAVTPEVNEDCVWMGNNLYNPDGLNCEELYQLWADYQDLCYIPYTLCVNKCDPGVPHDDPDPDPDPDGEPDHSNTGPKGDCDGDGDPNGTDPSPGC